MDAQAQVEKAIEIAWLPSADASLKPQALTFLESYKSEPSAWQTCLALFVREPRATEFTRHYCIDVLNHTIQQQSAQTLNYIRASLMDYVRKSYVPGSALLDTAHIQNKITQTFTYLFVALYASEWTSFFDDFRGLAGSDEDIGLRNPPATALYLRILGSVHDEIADTIMPKEPAMQKTHTELKDLVRQRDAQKIAYSWQEILAKWQWQEMESALVEMCLRTVSRWVMWIDISLVVNQTIITALFEISRQVVHAKTRDAAIDTFTEIIAKKMPPVEKMQLMRGLNIGTVVAELTATPALADQQSSDYDTDFAETVAKLVNTVLVDIVKVLEAGSSAASVRQQADELLETFVPFLLRFFGDDYDEVCSTVIPSLTDLLTFLRKQAKSKQGLGPAYRAMLLPFLESIIRKMKIDESLPWGEETEQTEEAEFQELRKKLHLLQQTVAAIDEPLFVQTVGRVVADTFTKLEADPNALNWRDLDLALHEMYLFGELTTRNGGLYQKHQPSSVASQALVEMMSKMVQTGVGSHPFPSIQLQFMEICVRHTQFFDENQNFIPQVLNSFVGTIHSQILRVRTRSWYLFQRFVKALAKHLGNVSQNIVEAIADLLKIKAELPRSGEDEDEMDSEDKGEAADALFNSQLYLFEAIGCISSVSREQGASFVQSTLNPIFADMERHLGTATNGDERSVLQLHHDIQAIGILARGFSDWMPGSNTGLPIHPKEITQEFTQATEAILVALEALKTSAQIRHAARFALSRMLAVVNTQVLQQLPRWIDALLSDSTGNDEMATFLRFLGQLIYAFGRDVRSILDTILTPMLQRVFAGLSAPTSGTDDEIQQQELKREFLTFTLVCLNENVTQVLVSETNQSTFETIVNVVSHYASDPADLATARLALAVCTRMTELWGGQDVALPSVPGASEAVTKSDRTIDVPQPLLPGFDSFAVTRFSPLCWAVPSSGQFKAKDPQSRSFITEVASLQEMILRKTSTLYLDELRRQLLGMGAGEADIDRYLAALVDGARKSMSGPARDDGKQGKGAMTGFRGFLASFLDRGGGAPDVGRGS